VVAVEEYVSTIGKTALLAAMMDTPLRESLMAVAARNGYRVVTGQVGSMDLQKVIAAIETAARREGIVSAAYPEDHALYHAILDALHGIGRGQIALGTILRTVGLRFSVVRGPQLAGEKSRGEWLAVAVYGQIGGPIKGNEHECVGLGVFHV
jgi:hut operon positive regulator